MESKQELQETPACAVSSALVSLAPFSPSKTQSPRRISGNFIHPNRPILSPRQPAWLSLEGRLIGAAEATSAKAVGNGWSQGETVAWELFSPMHRVLIVSVVAAAAADLKKTQQIFQLSRSVELRDQVLSSMQQKLDDLCEQMNSIKDQAETGADRLLLANSIDEYDASDLCSDGCQIHKLNKESTIASLTLNLSVESKKCASEKEANQDEMFKVTNMNNIEPEERRMSDLSDWCSSVTSSADIQLNTQALEQDICNLQKECEEKDAAIKELVVIAHATDIAGSKRISELEEIIRRKNMIISKLKKDMMVLEQKVLHLTRLRRPSFSASASDSNKRQLPVMAQNLLYDMDSSTSPSSSDSDCPIEVEERPDPLSHKNQVTPSHHDLAQRKTQIPPIAKTPTSFPRSTNRHLKQRPISPLKENNMNQDEALAVAQKPRQLASSVSDVKRNGRHVQSSSKDAAPQRRWV